MRTLARYISAIFLRNLALSVLVLSLIYSVNNVLADLLDGKFPIDQIVQYHLLNIPQIMVEMVPPAAMLGTVLTLSGLARFNELIACYSLGIGLRHVIGILVSMIFVVSCFSLVMQDRFLPPLFKKRTVFYWREMRGRTDFYIDIKQSKIWYRSGGLIYNLRTFDANNERIHGMAVYMFDDDFNLKRVIDAKTADHKQGSWVLSDGSFTEFSSRDGFPIQKHFESLKLVIEESPKDFQEIEKEVDGLRLKELYYYIEKTRNAGVDTKQHEVRMHYRISLSFLPIIMSILAVPFATTSRRQGGMGRDLAMGFLITFLYWLFYAVSLNLGKNGVLQPMLSAWLPSMFFGLLAIVLLLRKRTA